MTADRRTDLLRADAQMRLVRWVVIPFALAQFMLYRAPEGVRIPFNAVPLGLAIAGAVLVVNLVSMWSERLASERALEWSGRAQLAADTAIAIGVIWLFSFDESSALWALLLLPVLEGAIRAQVTGALVTWAACAAGYLARELVAPVLFPVGSFAIESFTYRMGILLVVAIATGYLARNLESRIVDNLAARRESDRRSELLHIVAAASAGINALDADRVLDAVVDASVDLGFDAATVVNLDEETGTYTQSHHRGLPETFTAMRRDSSLGLVGLVRSLRKTVVIDEYSEWASGLQDARELGFRTVAATPIWTTGTLQAVLIVASRTRAEVSAHETECLELLAAHAGAALTTARHFSERQALQARLDHEAFHDSLTGLPNRVLFRDRLDHCLERKSTAPSPTAVLLIDLDRMKNVNDSLGHEAGDEVLQVVTDRLQDVRGPGDTVARYTGDQFALLIEDPESQRAVLDTAGEIVRSLQEPLRIDGTTVYVSASVGVSYRYQAEGKARDFLREADLAMQRAKEQGGARAEAYRPVMSTRLKHRVEMERELRRALDRGEFAVHYQPAISVESGQVVGLEALVRWEHPHRGTIPASEFIPIAQDTGLIVPVGQWVLEEVGSQISVWRATKSVPPVPIGVNLSATEFAQRDFVDNVSSVLENHKLHPDNIIFEVTEAVVMRDDAETLAQMRKLEGIGIRLAIDDFGLGYSSLNYLKRFRFSVLKIDKSFVSEVTERQTDQAIVRHILALGKDLGLPVVAEGVETEEQLTHLRSAGCVYVQGFHLCKPVHALRLAEMLADGSLGDGSALASASGNLEMTPG